MTEAERVDGETDTDDIPDEQRSGLSNPGRAVSGLGSLVLGLEALVLLMAVAPLKILLTDSGPAIAVVLVLTVACVVLAGLTRWAFAWHAASGVQVVLLASGLLHWALAGVGVIFGLTWLYTLSVRRRILAPPRRDGIPAP